MVVVVLLLPNADRGEWYGDVEREQQNNNNISVSEIDFENCKQLLWELPSGRVAAVLRVIMKNVERKNLLFPVRNNEHKQQKTTSRRKQKIEWLSWGGQEELTRTRKENNNERDILVMATLNVNMDHGECVGGYQCAVDEVTMIRSLVAFSQIANIVKCDRTLTHTTHW